MIVYNNNTDELGELVSVNGRILVRFTEAKTVYKPYIESNWTVVGKL